jgi:TRAP-type C4-dicarboxylate transport system permease small subunit
MRFAAFAARAVDLMAIATFSGMFACVLGQVGFRYFLGNPLTWSDELARYLFVWCAFLGWIIAARRRNHLAIGSLPERASPRIRAALALLAAAAALAFAAVLAFYGTRIALRNVDVDTTTLFFTMGVVYAIVPLAAIAVGLHALADGRSALRALSAPAADPR